MEATLYEYWRSSTAYRVRIALNLLGVAYASVPVDLTAMAHKGEANLAINPQGLVPTLKVDGLTLTQSLAIIEYLNETRGGALLPADPAGRARVRALSHAIAMEITAVCNLGVAREAVGFAKGGIEMGDWMRVFIPRGLAAVERMLGAPETGRFCHGDAVSMADLCLAPQVYNARRWEVDLAPLPRIRAIDAALTALPAFAAARPEAQAGALEA